jgi:hypothetical protein
MQAKFYNKDRAEEAILENFWLETGFINLEATNKTKIYLSIEFTEGEGYWDTFSTPYKHGFGGVYGQET